VIRRAGAIGYGTLSYQEWIDMGLDMLDADLNDQHLKLSFMQSIM